MFTVQQDTLILRLLSLFFIICSLRSFHATWISPWAGALCGPRKPTIVVNVYPFSLTHTHMLICMVYRDSPMFFMLYKLYVLLPYTYPTPKLSPHRRRCISTFLQKTHSVWYISILNYGDTENVLINHLLLVIPMSYPCNYTNLCPHKPHKHVHTHTHTHTHSHTHSHTHMHSRIHTLSHTHTHTSRIHTLCSCGSVVRALR